MTKVNNNYVYSFRKTEDFEPENEYGIIIDNKKHELLYKVEMSKEQLEFFVRNTLNYILTDFK